MAKPKDEVAIDAFKFRSWKKADGTWTDPFMEYDFWSRTFLQEGTETISATSEEDMVTEIKKDDKMFKEEDLSEASKEKFKEKEIDDKIEIKSITK